MRQKEAVALLSNWVRFNSVLMTLPLRSVRRLLDLEMKSRRRKHYLERLHHRYNKLRGHAERDKLLRGDKNWKDT